MDIVQTKFIEKRRDFSRVIKKYRVLDRPYMKITKEFYAGGTDGLSERHLAFTCKVTDVCFEVSKYGQQYHLFVCYKFDEILNGSNESYQHESSFNYPEEWSQDLLSRSRFKIATAEVIRMIYAGLGHNKYQCIAYETARNADYAARIGNVLDDSFAEETPAIKPTKYDIDLDLVKSITVTPISAVKYIDYYRRQLADGHTGFTAEDVNLYERYVLDEFSSKLAAIQKEEETHVGYIREHVSDHLPKLGVSTFEYFNYQRRLVNEHAEDFKGSQEFIRQAGNIDVEQDTIRYGADIYGVK